MTKPGTCPRCGSRLTHAYPVDHDPTRVGTAFYACGSSWCYIDGMRGDVPDVCNLTDAVGELASVLRRHARYLHARAVHDALRRAERITGRLV